MALINPSVIYHRVSLVVVKMKDVAVTKDIINLRSSTKATCSIIGYLHFIRLIFVFTKKYVPNKAFIILVFEFNSIQQVNDILG